MHKEIYAHSLCLQVGSPPAAWFAAVSCDSHRHHMLLGGYCMRISGTTAWLLCLLLCCLKVLQYGCGELRLPKIWLVQRSVVWNNTLAVVGLGIRVSVVHSKPPPPTSA